MQTNRLMDPRTLRAMANMLEAESPKTFSMPTLLDVAALNGADPVVGLIDEASKGVPEVRLGAARTIRGLNYKTTVRTAATAVGFRVANQGTAVVKGVYEQRLVECYLMNPQFEVDKAVADAYEDGPEAYLAIEALGVMEGAFQALGRAFFYGNHPVYGLPNAFPGLLQSYDDANFSVDAGGTTDNVATSVWLVRWGVQDVQWVLGQGGELRVTDPVEVRLVDGNNNPYTGYRQELYLRPGLQVGAIHSVCRIKKLTTDAGKGLTDALIYEALSRFPAGRGPNAIYMNRRSITQLRASRTATNATGAPAPIPTDIEGAVDGGVERIPIFVTDSIANNESLAL